MRYEEERLRPGSVWRGFAVGGEWRPNDLLSSLMSRVRLEDYRGDAEQIIACYRWEWRRRTRQRGITCPRFDSWLLEPTRHEDYEKDQSTSNLRKNRTDISLRNPVILLGVHRPCDYKVEDFISLASELGFKGSDAYSENQLGDYLTRVLNVYDYPETWATRELFEHGAVWPTWDPARYPPYRPRSSST